MLFRTNSCSSLVKRAGRLGDMACLSCNLSLSHSVLRCRWRSLFLRLSDFQQTRSVIIHDFPRCYLIPHNLHSLPRIQPAFGYIHWAMRYGVINHLAFWLLLISGERNGGGLVSIPLLIENVGYSGLCFPGLVLLDWQLLLLSHDGGLAMAHRAGIVTDELSVIQVR